MEELHSCHLGMCRMKALGRNYVWWPTMNKEIEQLVSSYATCARFRNQGRTTGSATIGKLRSLFAAYGIPEELVSNNGPQFTSEEFSVFMKNNGIKHTTSAPYHPQRTARQKGWFKS